MKIVIVIREQRLSILLSFLIVGFFLFQTNSSYAVEENHAGATGFNYSIKFPDNQIDKELGYYHLKMDPGHHQKLSIILSNPNKEKVTIDVKVNGAKTNQNGVIEYGESTIENDQSLKFDFTNLVKAPKSVELAPGETKNLELTVDMPETGYDGVIAGGIQLMRAEQKDTTKNNNKSKIDNKYAYIIGMVLQEKEIEASPNLSLNSVKVGRNSYNNAIFINFSNIAAVFLNNVTVNVQITEKGKETVLYERKQSEMRMAPNSFIDFPISMNGELITPGDYEADILVTSGDKKWDWKEDFEITDEDANKFNESDKGLVQEKGLNWRMILLLVVAFVLTMMVLFSLLRFLRKNKSKKQRKKYVKKS